MMDLEASQVFHEEILEINAFCEEISWAIEKQKERMKLEESDLFNKIALLKSRIPSARLKSSFYFAKIKNLKEKHYSLSKLRSAFLQKLEEAEYSMKPEGIEKHLVLDHSEFVKMSIKKAEEVMKLWRGREARAQQAKLELETVEVEWSLMKSTLDKDISQCLQNTR